jgi:lipopolysaccharide export system permease protein
MLAFYFSNNVLPIANLKFQSLYYDIREKKLAFNIKEGIFYNELDGYTIRIGEKESDDIHIKDVMIHDHTDGLGNINVTIAKSGKMESTPDGRYMIFTLYDGHDYVEKVDEAGHRKNRPFERATFTEKYMKFDLGNFAMNHTDENLFKKHYMMLNIKQLKHAVDSLNRIEEVKLEDFMNSFQNNFPTYTKIDSTNFTQTDTSVVGDLLTELSDFNKMNLLKNASTNTQSISNTIKFTMEEEERGQEVIRRFIITVHEKFTLSFACLILFFIGAPMGAIIRKGGLGFPVVISVIFFIIFHIASITGKKYVIAGVLSPEVGMWLASILLLPIGIFLTYKATNDAPVLDADNYRKFFRVILNLIQRVG